MPKESVTNSQKQVHKRKTESIDNDPYVKGILGNDNNVISLIYREQFDKVKSMVNNFKNLNLDAKDVFQEGLTRAMMNVRDGRFKGDSAFPTYLYGICRNICLKEYQKNKDVYVHGMINVQSEDAGDDFELLQIILKEKGKLDEKCRKIIDLRFGTGGNDKGYRFEDIAEILGIKPDNARQRYGRCFAKLLEMLRENREFKLLTS
jgi:RNA polymerase sigma factor (sigma-70 family)